MELGGSASKRLSAIISRLALTVLLCACCGEPALPDCPPPDLTGDCFVDFEDFALLAALWPTSDFNDVAELAAYWLTTDPCCPPDMRHIPAGMFEMGDSLGEGWDEELPVHTVTVDSFYMGRYEVTNAEYCAFLNWADDNGWITVTGGKVYKAGSGTTYPYCATSAADSECQISYSAGVFSVTSKAGRDMSNDPMVMVSWYGAAAYCNWRSRQEGREQCYNLSTWNCDFSKKGYRLPTEAEWEYAARGGLEGARFPWGDTITHNEANYYSYWEGGHPFYPYDLNPTEGYHPVYDDIYPYTAPVGGFSANGYGLYDMAGNVWDLCNDWYEADYYVTRPDPDVNPPGPSSGTYRVFRGGGWSDSAFACRVTFRSGVTPRAWSDDLGFRAVLDLN